MSKHWWEEHVQPGMLFVSKTHLYCGGAHVPGSSGLLDPGAPALVVGTERVAGSVTYSIMGEIGPGVPEHLRVLHEAGSVTYSIMGEIGWMDAATFLSVFERVEG